MLDRDELQSAVSAGIVTADQADRLVAHYTRGPEPQADREEVRFARGFQDVFITIGLLILFAGLFLGIASLTGEEGTRVLATHGPAAIVAWLLAEWLARRRKLALPAIVLSFIFTWSFAVSAMALYAKGADTTMLEATPFKPLFFSIAVPWSASEHGLLVFALGALVGGALFYARFKVPIALTGLVAGGLLTVGALLETALPGLISDHPVGFVLIAGLVSFVLAMRFDARDLARTTLNTDKAFWLHLMAAPLIMHSVLSLIRSGTGTTAEAVGIIAVVLALGLIALVVDRRALLVSGLVYLGIAIFNLLRTSNVEGEIGIAAALFILGLFVLTLGSGWTSVRRLVLAPFAGSGLFAYVPPIRTRTQ